jgi:Raf kinase inhibitor-like YbhB/YbcL family protein
MKIESPAFGHGAQIPECYSRYGDNISPPLVFRDTPPNTGSLALIVDDPDAPNGTFTHWIVFNFDPAIEGLKQGCRSMDAREGRNDWGESCYGGPEPPAGEHRYFFRLYAVDRKLDCPNDCSRAEIDRALRGHVLAESELMGRFAKPPEAHRT